MEITGAFRTVCNQLSSGTGAFSVSEPAYNWNVGNNRQTQYQQANFKASNTWTGSTSNNSKVSSLYKDVTYVQPTAIQLRAKTRFK